MIIKRITKLVKDPKRLILYTAEKGLFNWMPDEFYIKMIFKLRTGKRINLENPATFNEKLQWLKLYDRKEKYIQYVDKYEVRKHIAESIGEEYLIPLIGVYNKPEEIDFSVLPDQFVLKCTHDSGGLVICNDKSQLDIKATIEKLNKCLKRNYYFHGREWPYKNVKPRIICEKFIIDESGVELKDYKLMCFNGKAKCNLVCLNRYSSTGLNIDFYDMDWKPMPFERRHHPSSGTIILRPKHFNKMIEFAERLSKDIPFARVDFYEIEGKLYFGELTFYPSAGFEEFTPESYDNMLGSWITLPSKAAN